MGNVMNVNRLLAGGALVGVLTIGAAAPALAGTITNVGGGTWNYGTAFQPPWFKNVWSHYVHPSAYHSATAIGGPNNVKVYANANSWANADTQCGAGENAAQYWATY
jgi:hypothetical protein